MTSKADKAVGLLRRFVQLAQPGKLPARREIGGRSPMAFGFLLIEYAPAQTSGDADNTVELVSLDELTPLAGDIGFILRGDTIAGRAMHAILIQK